MNFIKKEKKLLDIRIAELDVRRRAWSDTAKHLIHQVFTEAAQEALSVGHPFRLSSRIHDSHKNEETVQLSSGQNMTGVLIEENREIAGAVQEVKKYVVERGCSLVASFGIDGSVSFMLYPYSSERHSWREDCIVVKSLVDPAEISKELLEKVISQFFFYARFSSIMGTRLKKLDVELLRYYYLLLLDIRNQGKITKTALSVIYDWSKIIVAAAIGFYAANFGPS